MSTLTSYLTVLKLEPIPNSLEELVYNYNHKEECLITMQKGHYVLSKFYVCSTKIVVLICYIIGLFNNLRVSVTAYNLYSSQKVG